VNDEKAQNLQTSLIYARGGVLKPNQLIKVGKSNL